MIETNEQLLEGYAALVKRSARQKLGAGPWAEMERIEKEILTRMGYSLKPREIAAQVANVRHAGRRIEDIGKVIANLERQITQEYADLVAESKRLDQEIDGIVSGPVISVGGSNNGKR